MKQIRNKIRKFVRSEDGPTAVEYAIMTSLIIAVCLAAVKSVGSNLSSSFSKTSNSISGAGS